MKVSSGQSMKVGDMGWESSSSYEGPVDEDVKKAYIEDRRASKILKFFACAYIAASALKLLFGPLKGNAAPAA